MTFVHSELPSIRAGFKKRILKEKLKKILAEKEEKTGDLIDRSDRSNGRVSGRSDRSINRNQEIKIDME
jgi:hypothetical protein